MPSIINMWALGNEDGVKYFRPLTKARAEAAVERMQLVTMS